MQSMLVPAPEIVTVCPAPCPLVTSVPSVFFQKTMFKGLAVLVKQSNTTVSACDMVTSPNSQTLSRILPLGKRFHTTRFRATI